MSKITCPEWNPLNIPDGLCRCGCGKVTAIAKRNRKERQILKGQHLPYARYHEGRTNFTISETGCWVWNGKLNEDGYATTHWDNKSVRIFVALYQQIRGPIPAGLILDHLCRNKACVNPYHMEPVTWGENVRRGKSAKITQFDVMTIRKSSQSAIALGRHYGLSNSQVSRIKKGKRWTI